MTKTPFRNAIPKRGYIVLAVVTAVAIVGVGVGVALAHQTGHSFWRPFLAGETIVVIAMALTTVVLILLEHRNGPRLFNSLLFDLDKADRKLVAKAVGKGRSVGDARLAGTAVQFADEVKRRYQWLAALWLIQAAVQVPPLFTGEDNDKLLHGVLFCAFIVIATFGSSTVKRRADRSRTINAQLLGGRTLP